MLLVFLIVTVAAGADFAVASQAHCLRIFDILRSNMLKQETWLGDVDAVLDRLHDSYMPEITRVASTVEPTILSMEKKYVSLIDSKSEGSDYAIESIRNCTRDGLENIDGLFDLFGTSLERSYHNNVHTFAASQHMPDDLSNPVLLPIYTIKTDFVHNCKRGFDLVQKGIDGVHDTIHRIHATFNSEPDNTDNTPDNYLPIVESFLLPTFFDDFEEMKADGKEKDYPKYLMDNSSQEFKSILDDASNQISNAKDSVESFLNTTKTITDDDMRLKLVYVIRDKAADSQSEIEDIVGKAQEDIKGNIPEFYAAEGMTYSAMATICQETIEGFVLKANEIAEETINDFINLFEFLLDIAS